MSFPGFEAQWPADVLGAKVAGIEIQIAIEFGKFQAGADSLKAYGFSNFRKLQILRKVTAQAHFAFHVFNGNVGGMPVNRNVG